jgi:hypothetical protein
MIPTHGREQGYEAWATRGCRPLDQNLNLQMQAFRKAAGRGWGRDNGHCPLTQVFQANLRMSAA